MTPQQTPETVDDAHHSDNQRRFLVMESIIGLRSS
jgi:hypothetical protein